MAGNVIDMLPAIRFRTFNPALNLQKNLFLKVIEIGHKSV